MIQRSTSSPGVHAILDSMSSVSSGRSRVSRRRTWGGLVLVASLAVVGCLYFILEWRTEKLAISSSAVRSATPAPIVELPKPTTPSTPQEKIEVEPDPLPEPELEYRSFESFEAHVEASRARNGPTVMPVVELQDKTLVTVPSVIIIGARRAGTSSLFEMLSQHPRIASIVKEKPDDFMAQDPIRYPAEAEWPGDRLETELPAAVVGRLLSSYAGPFTLSQARPLGSTTPLVALERNPDYLSSPLAPYRLKMAIPDVKVIVVLRDPVERYLSDLDEKLCVSKKSTIDWSGIERSFAMPNACKAYLSTALLDYSPYDKRCRGEGASADDLWNCQQKSIETHAALLEGLYAGQVARWRRAFDRSQVKVINSMDLFQKPEKVAANVAKFLGLESYTFSDFASGWQASCDPRRRGGEIAHAYSKRAEAEPCLRKWYVEHNDELFEDLERDLHWNDRIRPHEVAPEKDAGGHRATR